MKHSKCHTFGSEMLQFEADLKTIRYFGGDIPETPIDILIFDKHCQC